MSDVPDPSSWPVPVVLSVLAVAGAGLGLVVWRLLRQPLIRPLPAVVVVTYAVVLTVLVSLGVFALQRPDRCQGGIATIEKRGGECVGVSDGSFSFAEELDPVTARIEEENERVTRSGKPYATVALMIPLTPAEDSPAERVQVVREVQGAYAAQFRSNQTGQREPPIRLVLANPGRDMTHWRWVSGLLADMSRSDTDRLRAVFGFNLSVKRTEQTIRYLTREVGLAVVGGPITADDLANDRQDPERYPGLAKIVPSNSDQARALTRYLKVPARATFLVEDISGDDIYSRSLRAAFRRETKGSPFAPEQYKAQDVTANDFEQMVNNLCDSDATTVYFSGRPRALAQLIRALGQRGCQEQRYRVVTVSGASTLALDPNMSWEAFTYGAGLAVEYATVTHKDAWTGRNTPATGGSKSDFLALSSLLDGQDPDADLGDIGTVDLADGRTITAHDSALTAIAGIRNRTTGKDRVPDVDSIAAAWPRLHGDGRVRGASGWICLDSYGTPYNKAVAIARLSPDPDAHITFERLAWPDGSPPNKQCTAPPEG